MYVETLMSDGSGDYKKPFGLQGIGLLLCAAVSWPTVSVGDQHCIRSVTFLLAN